MINYRNIVLLFSLKINYDRHCALVAQLDRAPGFEPGGRGFKSCRGHHVKTRVASFYVPRATKSLYVAVTTRLRGAAKLGPEFL